MRLALPLSELEITTSFMLALDDRQLRMALKIHLNNQQQHVGLI